MPVSKAQQKAQNKWIAKAYDRINLTVPKGKKDTIQAHAEALCESVNGFINRAIDNQISQDRHSGPRTALESTEGVGVVSLPSEALRTAQDAAQSAGETVPQFVSRAVATQAKRDEVARKMEGVK